ncbi:MAG TPA: hypothetical protein PL085_11505 [Agriterribacter sp.]|uniref:hypothetical protein n=1 Tax=Agriterribacter sp. TaxID=2821509 RepID=UPI002C403F4A|nr:hypothetical protein [Agriterribacter sp.]HRQ17695.1 hypothetical protein [Agriterribacter sp.]
MKKIIIILAALILSYSGYAQLDSSLNILNTKRWNEWFKKSNVPAYLINGYDAQILNGDTLVRASGSMLRAEEAKVYADGSNMSTALQAAFNFQKARWISFDSDSSRVYIFNSSLNAHGKTLEFKNGNKLSGTATIDSLSFSASDYDKIFDTTLNFTNLKSTKGYITPEQLGAKNDGTTDDGGFLVKALSIVSQNPGLRLQLNAGTYYITQPLVLSANNIKILGAGVGKTKLLMKRGTNITNDNTVVKNISIGGFSIEMVDGGSDVNTIFFNSIAAGDTSENILLHDIDMQMHRVGNSAIVMNRVKNSTAYNISIDSSRNVGITTSASRNVKLYNIRVTNAGRSGIVRGYGSNGYVLTNFLVDGFSQNQPFTDGGIDSYGPDNENAVISDGIIRTGDKTYLNAIQHIGIRDQGNKNSIYSNIIVRMQSQYGLYGVRIANRDDSASTGVVMKDIKIIYERGSSYGTVVSVQGAWDATFENVDINIDSAATTQGSPSVIRIASEPGVVDTVKYVKFSGTIKMNSKNGLPLNWIVPVKNVDLSGTKLYGFASPDLTSYQSAYDLQSLKWNGGVIESVRSGTIFRIYNAVRAFNLQNLDITHTNQNIWNVESGYNGVVIPGYNIVNGKLAQTLGGSTLRHGIVYNGASTYTISDTASLVICNRTSGNMTVTMPSASKFYGRPITIKNISATRGVKVVGITSGDRDSLVYKDAITYVSDTSGWRATSVYTEATGGGGSGETNTASNYGVGGVGVYNDKNGADLRFRNINAGSNKISVSLDNTSHEVDIDVNPANLTGIPQTGVTGLTAALDSLRQNDTIPVTFAKNATRDSIILTIAGTRMAVNDSMGSGGGGGSYTDSDARAAISLTTTGTSGAATYNSSTGVFNIPQYTGATLPTKPSGYLLSGTGSAGYDSTGLYWDKVNSRLGIGVASPTAKLDVLGDALFTTDSPITFKRVTTANNNQLEFRYSDNNLMGLIRGHGNNAFVLQSLGVLYLYAATGITSNKPLGANTTYSTTANLNIGASTTTLSSLRINPGVAPTTPNDGDAWYNGTNLYFRNGSTNVDLLAGGSSGVTSVSAGNGMSFSTITGTGSVVLGTPSNITLSSTNSATSGTHTHAFVPGGSAAQIIRGNGTLSDAIGNGYVKFSTATNQYTASNLIPYSDISSPPTIPDVTHGDYKPTIAAEFATLNSSTIDTFSYTKIGDKVHAWGQITVTTNTDALTGQSIYITLPFASTFTDAGQLTGAGAARKSATPTPLSIQAVNYSGVGYAEVSFNRTSGSSETFVLTITFDYKIRAGGD